MFKGLFFVMGGRLYGEAGGGVNAVRTWGLKQIHVIGDFDRRSDRSSVLKEPQKIHQDIITVPV